MIERNRWQHSAFAVTFAMLAIAAVSAAQSGTPSTINPSFETRAQLETQAQTAEAEGRGMDARLIRHRLNAGDFQDGDRIFVTVRGPGGFSDTLVVRSGRQLDLAQLPPLPLTGVLRSE